MFYAVGSAKIPLSKRAETMELVKKYRDHINATYDDVSVEIVTSLSVGELVLIVEKFDSRVAWANAREARKGDEGVKAFFGEITELYDRIDSHQEFYEVVE